MCPAHYAALPQTITVRELKTGGRLLITSLLCPRVAPKAELKDLCKQRWTIELDVRDIQSTLGMGFLTCKTPELVAKEL